MKCSFSKKKYYSVKRAYFVIPIFTLIALTFNISTGVRTEGSIALSSLLLAVTLILPALAIKGTRYSNDRYVVLENESVKIRTLKEQLVDIVPLVVVTEIRTVQRIELKRDIIIVYGANIVREENINDKTDSNVKAEHIVRIDRVYENEDLIINKLIEMERK